MDQATKDRIAVIEAKTGHAVFSPSQMPRIALCPASFKESLDAPIQPSSVYAIRGTKLHEMTEQVDIRGTSHLLTLDLDATDTNQVLDALDYKDEVINKYHTDSSPTILREVRSDLSSWGLPMIYGTSDYNILGREEVDIIDWKFGSGPVEAIGNLQLVCYGAGVVGANSPIKKVRLHIAQPPINSYQCWELEMAELELIVTTTLAEAIENCLVASPKYNPGEKQCKFCAVKNDCTSRHAKAESAAVDIFRDHAVTKRVSDAQLRNLLDQAGVLEQYIKDIRNHAYARLMDNKPFAGYKLVRARSSRYIEDQTAMDDFLDKAGLSELDRYAKAKRKSPNQLEQANRSFKKDPEFQALIKKRDGKLNMVPESHKGKAVTPKDRAEDAFKDLPEPA